MNKELFFIGIASFLFGIAIQLLGVPDNTVSMVYFVSFFLGFVQLIRHIVAIFKLGSAHIFFKILTTWFLLSFGLISGYVVTLVCILKKKDSIVEVFE